MISYFEKYQGQMTTDEEHAAKAVDPKFSNYHPCHEVIIPSLLAPPGPQTSL